MTIRAKGKAFVSKLFSELCSQLPQYQIDFERGIEWYNQARSLWPKADLLIEKPDRWFIVEYDEDSDPGRSLTKYWPYIDLPTGVPITVIEIWRGGAAIGCGYAKLAKFIGTKLMERYPSFRYEFIERTDETAYLIAQKVARIVEQV